MIVATQLTATDAFGAHARDELDLFPSAGARPVQAAVASVASFTVGAAMPLAAAFFTRVEDVIPVVAGGSLFFLSALGGLGAYAGRSPIWRGTMRVTAWGASAMVTTAAIGRLICVTV